MSVLAHSCTSLHLDTDAIQLEQLASRSNPNPTCNSNPYQLTYCESHSHFMLFLHFLQVLVRLVSWVPWDLAVVWGLGDWGWDRPSWGAEGGLE